MASLRDIRDQVKLYVGDPEYPERLIDEWVRSGLRRLNSEALWPWQHRHADLSVPASGRPHHGTLIERCRRVSTVRFDAGGGLLALIGFEEAMRRWPHAGDRSGVLAAEPSRFTLTSTAGGQIIRLWPDTSPGKHFVGVWYHEWPADWPVTDVTAPTDSLPVAPAAHEVVIQWVLGEALLREAQPAEASTKRAMYHQQIANLRSSLLPVPPRVRVGSDLRV